MSERGALLAPLPSLAPLTRARLAALELRDERMLRDFLLENLGRHLTRTRDLYEALRALEYLVPRGGIEALWRAAAAAPNQSLTVVAAAEALGLRRGLARMLLLHFSEWRYVEQKPAANGEAWTYRFSRRHSEVEAFLGKLLTPEDGFDLRDTTRMYRSETGRFLTRAWLDPEGDRMVVRCAARYLPLADEAAREETLRLDAGEMVHAIFRLIPTLESLELDVSGAPGARGGDAPEVLSLEIRRSTYRSLDDEVLPQELPGAVGARFDSFRPLS